MLGIGRPSVRPDGADGGPRRGLTIAHPFDLGPNRPKKNKKKLLIPSVPSSQPQRLAAATPSNLSRMQMPLCLTTVARPIRRRSLAPVASASCPSRRALALVVLAQPVARAAWSAEPRPVLVVLVAMVRMRRWC
jgi:hypothetical protein